VSDSEAWNAGATELALNFTRRHRRWFPGSRLLAGFPIFLVGCILIGALPDALGLSVMSVPYWVLEGALCFMLGAILLNVTDYLFPPAQVLVSKNENFVRKYTAEITLVLTLLSLVTADLSWVFP
jgi:hypothetical protein